MDFPYTNIVYNIFSNDHQFELPVLFLDHKLYK
jgi:hypothetical protein